MNIEMAKWLYLAGAVGMLLYMYWPIIRYPFEAKMNWNVSFPEMVVLSFPIVLFWPATLVFLAFNRIDSVCCDCEEAMSDEPEE